jgi:alpha-ketoglutarate-dependent taurine dioxygenase
LQIKPVSEHVGAEISDVNLATSLSNDTFEKIEDAYNRYSLLIFRAAGSEITSVKRLQRTILARVA